MWLHEEEPVSDYRRHKWFANKVERSCQPYNSLHVPGMHNVLIILILIINLDLVIKVTFGALVVFYMRWWPSRKHLILLWVVYGLIIICVCNFQAWLYLNSCPRNSMQCWMLLCFQLDPSATFKGATFNRNLEHDPVASNFSGNMKNLVRSLLNENPQNRPSTSHLIATPFLMKPCMDVQLFHGIDMS